MIKQRTSPTKKIAREDRISNWFTVIIYLIINSIVLFNVLYHDPRVGFDTAGHRAIIVALSEGRLPTPEDSNDFHSPPLPYIIPAITYRIAQNLEPRLLESVVRVEATGDLENPALVLATKTGQVQLFFVSLLACLYLVKLASIVSPNLMVKPLALGLFGMVTVFYKTFTQIRGEPFLMLFVLVVVYLLLKLIANAKLATIDFIALSLSLALAFLSRHMGLALIPAIFLFLFIGFKRRIIKKDTAIKITWAVLITGILVISLFYIPSYFNLGNTSTFQNYRFELQRPAFYLSLSLDVVFTDPIRPSFLNQLIPVLYADTWGDYWSIFQVKGIDTRKNQYVTGSTIQDYFIHAFVYRDSSFPPNWLETNRIEIKSYLARVMAFSLVPSAILVAGFITGSITLYNALTRATLNSREFALLLLTVTIIFTLILYLLLLHLFSDPEGEFLKPTYLLQIFPLLAVLGAESLARLRNKKPVLYKTIAFMIVVAGLHNLPVFITKMIPLN